MTDIGIAHHTSIERGTYRDDHGTPAWLIERVREAFGGVIDLDLASDEEADKVVRANAYYTRESPCPPRIPRVAKNIWCNPPGPGKLVKQFWLTWLDAVTRFAVPGAFLVFNLDHLRQLQRPQTPLWVVFLEKRLRFEGAKSSATFPSALVCTDDVLGSVKSLGHVMRWEK